MTLLPVLVSLARHLAAFWDSLTAPRSQPSSDLETYLSQAVDMHHLESLERNWERRNTTSAARGYSF